LFQEGGEGLGDEEEGEEEKVTPSGYRAGSKATCSRRFFTRLSDTYCMPYKEADVSTSAIASIRARRRIIGHTSSDERG
jgi:hypothetical protein